MRARRTAWYEPIRETQRKHEEHGADAPGRRAANGWPARSSRRRSPAAFVARVTRLTLFACGAARRHTADRARACGDELPPGTVYGTMSVKRADTTSVTGTFLFADIAGVTALTEAHGDEEAVRLVADFGGLAPRCRPSEGSTSRASAMR